MTATTRDRWTIGPEVIRATFHHDAGHGWLQVDVSDLAKIGASPATFSAYSYLMFGVIYLEEDDDAGDFIQLAKAAGVVVDVHDGPYQETSFVRSLPHNSAGWDQRQRTIPTIGA